MARPAADSLTLALSARLRASQRLRQWLFKGSLREILLRTVRAATIGTTAIALLRLLLKWFYLARQKRAESLWRRHVDFSDVQACLMSTEHLASLGRVEKRTLFVKPVSEVFRNEYMLSRVLAAADKAVSSGEPMLVTQLSAEDKWHVLNTCTNHISSIFAPHHVFFSEARRAESNYTSAWYCFTLTCTQTNASGRWFITPYRPVGVDDVGMLRIRILLMNEQELRNIASGSIEPPASGFFNGRHASRWAVCLRFAEFFERQVQHQDHSPHPPGVPRSLGSLSSWSSPYLGPRHSGWASSHNLHERSGGGAEGESSPAPQVQPEDNAMLRVHVPFPSSRAGPGTMNSSCLPSGLPQACDPQRTTSGKLFDGVAQDVVLFE
eukprot:TRINITY_DN55031_c0_g1_i1.p1 TRINITY_DN55031_c0_g1~~TRINITY_DN55031_c0_g1_i1.p1  ORF type:complete len:404 (-),score=47.79 TRINITY_DN55031_c0_g1_i1:37-1176(-)